MLGISLSELELKVNICRCCEFVHRPYNMYVIFNYCVKLWLPFTLNKKIIDS